MEETSQLTEYPMGYLRLITYVLENCIHCIESNSKRVSFYRKKKKNARNKDSLNRSNQFEYHAQQ